jgi:dihydroorotase
LTYRLNSAYTAAKTSNEGIRDATAKTVLDGEAVSRTDADRGTVFFCIRHRAMTRDFLLRGGYVVDPVNQIDGQADVRVRNGGIAEVGHLDHEVTEEAIDVGGLIVAPGFVDVHVHLREPGQEWKETIGTGTAAAAAGGFTTIFCMPNTDPALDSVVMLEELKRRCDRDAAVNVRPIAAISEGRRGDRPVDFAALAAAGAVGFSDDGDSTRDSGVMKLALDASARLGIPVMVHCEDAGLVGGAMHEGDISRKLGVEAIPAAAEEIMITRDLALAAMTGGWLHVCHVSTGKGARAVAAARANGARVTAEVMPHHLTMTDAWVAGSRGLENTGAVPQPGGEIANGDTKVNPPLRTRRDTEDLLRALQARDIEIVATDHAPHAVPEKQGRPFATAAFGLSGSEVALPLMLALVRAGHLGLSDLVDTMSATPARLWGLPAGSLQPGVAADIVVFDPDEEWAVSADTLTSRSANTPTLGLALRGRVKWTFVAGDERHRD